MIPDAFILSKPQHSISNLHLASRDAPGSLLRKICNSCDSSREPQTRRRRRVAHPMSLRSVPRNARPLATPATPARLRLLATTREVQERLATARDISNSRQLRDNSNSRQPATPRGGSASLLLCCLYIILGAIALSLNRRSNLHFGPRDAPCPILLKITTKH